MRVETTWEGEVLRKLREAASIEWARTAVADPDEARHLLNEIRATIVKSRLDRETVREQTRERLSALLGEDEETIAGYQREIARDVAFRTEFSVKWEALRKAGAVSGTTSPLDAQAMYVLCRVVEPDAVVQTGVKYGSFDAHVAAALDRNGSGRLYGVDLPGAVDEFEFGYLIPEEYRSRWELRRGDARDVLPDLLDEVGPVDVFLHDSKHTRSHMRWEYETAAPALADGGVLASHDVLMTDAFGEFADERGMARTSVRNVGIATA